jgi:hypothetical protein
MPDEPKPPRKHRRTRPKAVAPAKEPVKLSPYRLAVLERQSQAFNLRRAGLGFEDIARTVRPPYRHPSGAKYAFEAAMRRRYFAPPEEMRKLELERLDALQVEFWKIAQGGSIKAHEALLKLMKRRAELEGLDKPMRVEVAGPGGGPIKVREVIIEHDAHDDTPA